MSDITRREAVLPLLFFTISQACGQEYNDERHNVPAAEDRDIDREK